MSVSLVRRGAIAASRRTSAAGSTAYALAGVGNLAGTLPTIDSGDWTAWAWVKRTAATVDNTPIFTAHNGSFARQQLLWKGTLGRFSAIQAMTTSPADSAAAASSTGELAQDVWKLVVAVFDSATSTISLYVGDESTALAEVSAYNNQTAGVGARRTGGTSYQVGDSPDAVARSAFNVGFCGIAPSLLAAPAREALRAATMPSGAAVSILADGTLANPGTGGDATATSATTTTGPVYATGGGGVTPATFTITADTTTYLANPGIGWQETDTSEGRTDTPPETVFYRRAVGSFFWGSIHTAVNTYDWSRIDNFLAECATAGALASFRVISMRGESFGNHQLPAWVVTEDAGSVGGTSSSGTNYRAGVEPNYENVTYQTRWSQFCEVMRARYDGDPRIAYVDISGYGDFNEWTFLANHEFLNTPSTPGASVQGHARRFLTHLFVGGSASDHRRNTAGNASVATGISYTFPGWTSTQLVMPQGGIRHHSAWVAANYPNVGHRRDNLGTDTTAPLMWDAGSTTQLGGEFTATLKAWDYIKDRWKTAPFWFEQAANNSNWTNQGACFSNSHGTGVHDNWTSARSLSNLNTLMLRGGYRLTTPRVLAASAAPRGGSVSIEVDIKNLGYAPPYPRMGQAFEIRVALRDASNVLSGVTTVAADPLTWVPNDDVSLTAPTVTRTTTMTVPAGISAGTYTMSVAVWDTVADEAVLLAQAGRNATTGYYDLGSITVS